MDVQIKDFNVEMMVKNKGIELDIKTPAGDHLGDLVITKTTIEWCNGRTRAGNGKSLTWHQFIEMMNALP